MAEDAPILHDDLFTDGVTPKPERPSNVAKRMEFKLGDANKGFAAADVTVERAFTTKPVHQGYIEPHAVVAEYSEDGQIQLWCSSQGQFMVRNYTANILGIEAAQIRVTPRQRSAAASAARPSSISNPSPCCCRRRRAARCA